MASQRSPKPHAAGSTPAALASSLTTESDNEGGLSSNGRAVGFQPADARSTRVSRSTFARVAQWTQSVRLRTGRPQVQVLPRAPYIHGWPSGRSARLQSVMSAVRFRGRGLNGPVVIMGARLACNQDAGVRFPPGPPFRARLGTEAAGLRSRRAQVRVLPGAPLTAGSAEADARSFYLRVRGFDSRPVVQILRRRSVAGSSV